MKNKIPKFIVNERNISNWFMNFFINRFYYLSINKKIV